MIALIWFILLIFWVICGYYAFGYEFAYFQREYPDNAEKDYLEDRRNAVYRSLFGPLNLILLYCYGMTKHGRKYE